MPPLDPTWHRRLERDVSEDPDAPRAGVAVVVRDLPGAPPSVLLMKRAEHPLDPWSGHVSLPGGRVDPQDANTRAAAAREALEELGVDLDRDATLVGGLAPLVAKAHGRALDLRVHPWVWRVERDLALVPNEEAEEGFWMSLTDAFDGTLDHTHRIEHAGETLLRPAWLAPSGEREHVVWGLTFHILRRFVDAVS